MNEQYIIQNAIHNLYKDDIHAEWRETANDDFIDGKLTFHMKYHPAVVLNVEVKKELRAMHLNNIENKARNEEPYMIVADRIFPKIKQELKERRINYLETSGNMFLLMDGLYINIEGRKNEMTAPASGNRAFTKTGLQVIYLFLIDEEWVNRPYREIAKRTGTGLGNINNIFNGLAQEGYLLQLTKNEQRLENKKQLLEKWILEYEKRLKPTLHIGTFRFLREEDFYNWKGIHLKNQKTYWGGEPAGALYTDYLRPEELTIYTAEEWNDLIRHYKLVPDKNGNVKVFKKFWAQDIVNENAVHPLLAYADLINKGDRRCTETAQRIYDEYLQDKF
nr:type IV toxin-antitoxin system AbiEi family antitoxin [uncultured Flavobacterium sp.]